MFEPLQRGRKPALIFSQKTAMVRLWRGLVSCVLALLCCLFFYGAAVSLFVGMLPLPATLYQQIFWKTTEGVVVETLGGRYADVVFITREGREQKAMIGPQGMMGMPHGFKSGDRVPLLYNVSRPSSAVFDAFVPLYGESLALGLGALIYGYLGWGCLRQLRKRWRKAREVESPPVT